MNVTSQVANSIKEKKNRLVASGNRNAMTTPTKTPPRRNSQIFIDTPQTRVYPSTAPQKSAEHFCLSSQPKNAFMKKCFQRKRQILPIHHLIEAHNQQRLKNLKESQTQESPQRKGIRSVLSEQKRQGSKSPAHSATAESKVPLEQPKRRERRGISATKKIKFSITQGK